MKSKSEYLDYVEEKFLDCFSSKKYIYSKPVKITSKIDSTVDFVGSKISPLKHFIVENNIPSDGVFTIQNCMKLRALKYLLDTTNQTFGSCYRGMGTLTNYDLDKIVYDTFDYLINKKYLGLNPNDICVRINQKDYDLIKSVDPFKEYIKIEYNTEPIQCYKHVYGMDKEHITGRNFNISIRKKGTSNFFDCAAIIVMETPERKIGIDMGIGNTSLAMCYFNENNTVSASRIADLINIDSNAKMRLADSISAVATLLYEDVQNSESKHFRKKFRHYIKILDYWKEYFNLSDHQVANYIKNYLVLEYNDKTIYENNEIEKVLTLNKR